jgi:hypothetical protein
MGLSSKKKAPDPDPPPKRKGVRILAAVGDVIEIPLSNGRFVYAQYVGLWPQGAGPLIRIFSPIRPHPVDSVSQIDTRTELIPPVFIGLNPPIRSKQWKVIGTLPVEDFVCPTFRDTSDLTEGRKLDWKLLHPDGTSEFIGELPESKRHLGYAYTHSSYTLNEQLIGGRYAGDRAY